MPHKKAPIGAMTTRRWSANEHETYQENSGVSGVIPASTRSRSSITWTLASEVT